MSLAAKISRGAETADSSAGFRPPCCTKLKGLVTPCGKATLSFDRLLTTMSIWPTASLLMRLLGGTSGGRVAVINSLLGSGGFGESYLYRFGLVTGWASSAKEI